jgi:hypothetical protein
MDAPLYCGSGRSEAGIRAGQSHERLFFPLPLRGRENSGCAFIDSSAPSGMPIGHTFHLFCKYNKINILRTIFGEIHELARFFALV